MICLFYNFRRLSGIELGGGSFLVHKMYEEEESSKLLDTTASVLGKFCEFVEY
jgi:hypothetical protein